MDFCKSQRPLQPIESLKTSPPHYQRPVHIPVQMVYPAIQKTSDDNRKKTDIRSDSDIKEHDIEDSNMADQQEDGSTGRRQRGFVPERMKDARYWVKRIKNNLAAKRSREKRRMADVVMESKVSKLAQENEDLRSELANIKRLVHNNLIKDARQEVVLGGRDVLLPSQGTQTQFAVGAVPQSIPLIIPTYPNPVTTFPAPPPPQGVFISPQTGLPQSTLPQPGLSQSGFPQAGLLRPMFLQDGSPQSRLPHHSFPQAVQPVRQQMHNLHGTQDSVKVVQGSSDATLVNGSCPQFISPEKNISSASRSEFSDPSRLQVLSTCVEKDKSRPPSNPLQNSAVESIDTSAKAPNGVIKVRAEKVCSVVDVEISEDQEISERTAPVLEFPMSESKSVSVEDDRKSLSASPNSSDTYDTPSPAEINKLPHKLRARFLRSLCQQEETAKTTVSDVHAPSDQPPMKADPVLMNIKKEKEDDVSHDEVSHVNSECPSGTSSYPWILPKSEFPLHPLRSIEEELEQARNLLPTPSRTMTRSESQAYAELAKAAADLVGVRLQSQDFSAPSMRQLTRQRTRDMNQEEKYRDKRVRNNIAAKKCRDAKRLLIEYRSARSNFFEVENMTLRNEVESLTKDVIRLRELVRRKQLSHNTDAIETCTL